MTFQIIKWKLNYNTVSVFSLQGMWGVINSKPERGDHDRMILKSNQPAIDDAEYNQNEII